MSIVLNVGLFISMFGQIYILVEAFYIYGIAHKMMLVKNIFISYLYMSASALIFSLISFVFSFSGPRVNHYEALRMRNSALSL